ncbi:hypothetical protein ACIU1J_15345 [Azospirillum doebereinerae]|uniref:hypothetical protein n=1 Tax=Azospirillum doebereinerae TaxID=92933 RepID=UPI001EE4F42C|nr:hypothetical protein [Azospirillum doebereinerae]MCG5242676.1 hypothetical protein [Azospirillum doebereinerae]
MLDEPNANLDAEGEQALSRAIAALKERGVCVVVIGHRPGTLSQVDRVVALREGRVEAFGPRADVLEALKRRTLRSVAGGRHVAAGRGAQPLPPPSPVPRPPSRNPWNEEPEMTRDLPAHPPVGRFVAAGLILAVGGFGGFAAWAALAPLTSAAVATGVVTADSKAAASFAILSRNNGRTRCFLRSHRQIMLGAWEISTRHPWSDRGRQHRRDGGGVPEAKT